MNPEPGSSFDMGPYVAPLRTSFDSGAARPAATAWGTRGPRGAAGVGFGATPRLRVGRYAV